jgi:GNAT superfamily N-acetyltransferase
LVDWRYLRADEDIPRWVWWEGGRIVAASGCYLQRDQNLDNALGLIYVLPDSRLRGLGRLVAQPMFDYIEDDHRIRFAVAIPTGSPVEDLAKRAGMKDAYRERVSQLRLVDVDRDQLDRWIERARERASDYELVSFSTPVPAEYREQAVAIIDVMNTAPLEDFEEDPLVWTEEMQADLEAMETLKKRTVLTFVAVHKPSGVFAGYTNVAYQSLHPAMAHQWDTGVDPAHRNRGLGRWLKAAMLKQIMDKYPEVEIIETENAESNTPMLNINIELGFKPSIEQILWQGDTRSVREALSV